MPTTKRSAAVYGLESSDTSDIPVEEGAAVLEGAPDLIVPMPLLANKKESIENDDVCIGLWCFYWSLGRDGDVWARWGETGMSEGAGSYDVSGRWIISVCQCRPLQAQRWKTQDVERGGSAQTRTKATRSVF